MIEQELHKNAAVITKVSETASKEFAIESALDKMQGAWAAVKLNTEEYRETGPPLPKNLLGGRTLLSLSTLKTMNACLVWIETSRCCQTFWFNVKQCRPIQCSRAAVEQFKVGTHEA